jgi:hypothetical protein
MSRRPRRNTLLVADASDRYSKTGAIHRYYACSTCARKGKTVCKGRSIPMDKLDSLVTTLCVYQKPKPGRSDDEVRQGWRLI